MKRSFGLLLILVLGACGAAPALDDAALEDVAVEEAAGRDEEALQSTFRVDFKTVNGKIVYVKIPQKQKLKCYEETAGGHHYNCFYENDGCYGAIVTIEINGSSAQLDCRGVQPGADGTCDCPPYTGG